MEIYRLFLLVAVILTVACNKITMKHQGTVHNEDINFPSHFKVPSHFKIRSSSDSQKWNKSFLTDFLKPAMKRPHLDNGDHYSTLGKPKNLLQSSDQEVATQVKDGLKSLIPKLKRTKDGTAAIKALLDKLSP